MNKATFTAYASLAQGDESGGDHVCVSNSDNVNWGCFGRTLIDMQNEKDTYRQVAQGEAYTQWAQLIENGNNAGLANESTGRCHNVANRILALAGTDVRKAGADALIMFVYGKYGFNVQAYLDTVVAAAAQINAQIPNAITRNEITQVLSYINQAQEDELEILEEFFLEGLGSQTMVLNVDQKNGLISIYQNYCKQRALFESDPATFAQNIKPVVLDGLKNLQALLGDVNYGLIFKEIPEFAVQKLFPS